MQYDLLGIAAGSLSGLIGIGGGILIVPALVFLFRFTQLQAQGTTLALLVPPIGLIAALSYYKQGYVDVRAASFIALGFLVGSVFGSKIAMSISNEVLTKLFGVVLLGIGIKMILGK